MDPAYRSGDVVSQSGGLGRRLLVTAAGVAGVLALGHLPLPVDDSLVQRVNSRVVSVGALSVMPFLSGYITVEWAALAVPRWRHLRHGTRRQRRMLELAAWLLGGAYTALQTYGIVSYLRQLRLPGVTTALAGDAVPMAAGLLVVGGLASAALAALVIRHGLGNGWVLLLLAPQLVDVGRALGSLADRAPEQAVAVVAAGLVAGILVARWLGSSGSLASAPAVEPRVTVPTCGTVPLTWATSVLLLPATAAAWFPSLQPLAEALRPGGAVASKAYLIVAAVLAVIFPWFFSRADEVVRGWERLAGPDAPAARAVALEARSRANLRSTVFIAIMAALPLASGTMSFQVDGGLLALAAALTLDLAADVRTFSGTERLASLRPLHRVHAVEPILTALRRAGIPASARSRHVRSLFHFFAPYVPVEVLVPADRAAEASKVLEGIVGDGPVVKTT